MGGEANSIVKDHSQMLARMAFLFPDTYEIGMSNNGMRILYHVVNREPDMLCEVAFAPWDDMAREMKKYDIPLYTHASYTPVRDFDVIGITLQTELNFTNVPYVLELARIPAWQKDRGENDPIVVSGGPAMANPEPVADFFDAIATGGEVKHGKPAPDIFLVCADALGVFPCDCIGIEDAQDIINDLEQALS